MFKKDNVRKAFLNSFIALLFAIILEIVTDYFSSTGILSLKHYLFFSCKFFLVVLILALFLYREPKDSKKGNS